MFHYKIRLCNLICFLGLQYARSPTEVFSLLQFLNEKQHFLEWLPTVWRSNSIKIILVKEAEFVFSLLPNSSQFVRDYCQRFGTQEGARSQHIKESSAVCGPFLLQAELPDNSSTPGHHCVW